MIIEGVENNSGRVSLNMNKTEALALIAKLAQAVQHFHVTGGAYFSDGVTYDTKGQQFAGRITFRIEDQS